MGSARKVPTAAYRTVFTQWGVRYLTWTQRRYRKNAAGGGQWPALKPATIARRRGEGKGVRILIDTKTLLGALTPGRPGNLFKFITGGVRVGFGGPSRHPGGKATIRDIAVFHQKGKGHLPKRQILHEPDSNLVRAMMLDLKRAVKKIGRIR